MIDEIRKDIEELVMYVDLTCDDHEDQFEILDAYSPKVDKIMVKIESVYLIGRANRKKSDE